MLDLSEDSLMKEIRDSQESRDKHLLIMTEVRRRYAGKYYRKDLANNGIESTPENYPFAYVAFVKPQIFYQAPAVSIDATRSIADVPTGDGLAMAMNYWIAESDFAEPVDEALTDALFGFGVMFTTVEAYGQHGGGGQSFVEGDSQQRPMWPAAVRLSPYDMLWDSRAESQHQCRLWGHTYERDLDDVVAQAMQDDTWDPAAVSGLSVRPDSDGDDKREAFPKGVDQRRAKRNTVRLHQLYIPEARKIVTLAETGGGDGGGKIVRTQDYFGPDEGPYTLFAIYKIPDEFVPLAVLVACFEQFLEVQSHAMTAADNAASYKKLAVGRTDAGKDAEVYKNARNGDVILLSRPDSMTQLETGGASPEQMNYLGVGRDRLDRVMGFSDGQRGIVNSDTATANQIAENNSDLRISFMRLQVAKCCKQALEKVLWYFYHLDSIRIQLMARHPQTGQMVEATYQGGQWNGGFISTPMGPVWQQPDDPEMDYTSFALRLDVESLNKQDDPVLQKRAQDQLMIGLQMIGMGFPVNIRFLLDDWGRTFNKVDYAKRFLLDQGQMGVVPPDTTQAFYPQQPAAAAAQRPAPSAAAAQRPAPPASGAPGMEGAGFGSSASAPGMMPQQPRPSPFGQNPAGPGAGVRRGGVNRPQLAGTR